MNTETDDRDLRWHKQNEMVLDAVKYFYDRLLDATPRNVSRHLKGKITQEAASRALLWLYENGQISRKDAHSGPSAHKTYTWVGEREPWKS